MISHSVRCIAIANIVYSVMSIRLREKTVDSRDLIPMRINFIFLCTSVIFGS